MEPSKTVRFDIFVRSVIEQSSRRALRVSALREAIASGTYRVSTDRLAEALLQSLRR